MIKLLQRTRRPDITFCRNGRISITARVVRLLSLQPGDSINIAFHYCPRKSINNCSNHL